MTDDQFLETYDPAAFAPFAVTVDLVLLAIVEGRLCAVLQRRDAAPGQGRFALPGGFVGPEESLDEAARRIGLAKVKLDRVWLEQLYTFGDPDRDPRMRIVTVAYYALFPAERLIALAQAQDDLVLAPLRTDWEGEKGAPVAALDENEAERALAFDHAQILGTAVARLRGKLDYAPIAFFLLPREFALRELQDVHEAIVGRTLTKPAFRRRMLDQGWIEATGKFETGSAYRPAELYRLKPEFLNPQEGE